ncbi:MAG: MFS transporter [Zoogloeaceae bacterium]|jgi:MFS family permease|nr:MFS transporter [Zoogloeaceae bacterium]
MKNASGFSIFLILLFAVLIAICHGKSMLLVGDFARAFDVAPARASWIVSAVAVIAALASPIVTWLVTRFGERRSITVGLLIAGGCSYLESLTGGFYPFLALRVVEGAGYITVVLAALALLIHTTQGALRVRALAFWSVASPLGGAIAIFAVSPYIGGDWRVVFKGHAIVLALLLLAIPLLPAANLASKGERKPFAGIFGIYRHPSILRLAAAVGAPLTAALGLVTVVPHYFINVLNIEPATIGMVATLSILSSVLAGGVAGYILTARVGPLAVVIGAFGGLALEIFVFLPGVSANAAILAKIFQGFFGSFVTAWVFTNIPKMSPGGNVMGAGGIAEQFLYISMFLGPMILFPLYMLESRLPFFIVLAIASLLPLLLLPLDLRNVWNARRPEDKRVAPEAR